DFENWSNQIIEQEEKELKKLNKKLDLENDWLKHGITARRKRNQQRLKNLIQLRNTLKDKEEEITKLNSSISFPPLSSINTSQLMIELQNVSFHYENNSKNIIDNFSLKILKGDKVGIIGPNGSGKTTLTKLIIG